MRHLLRLCSTDAQSASQYSGMSIICEGMKRVVRRLTYINAPAIDDDQIRKFHHTDANSVLEALPGSRFLRPPSVP
jgi:hypothetical protein